MGHERELKLIEENKQPVKKIIIQPEVPFEKQFIYENTIYIVDSNCNLKTSKIRLPQNCILKFEGGCINNGELFGRQTRIEASPYQIFDNVIITGSWSVEECYAEWFGAVGNGKHDDGPALRAALASPFRVIRLLGTNIYGVGSYADEQNRVGLITYHDNTTIVGSHKGTEEQRCPQIKALPKVDFNVFLRVNNRITTLIGFQIYGNYENTQNGYKGLNIKRGIEVNNGKKMLGYFEMDNIEVGYVKEDAMHLSTYCCEIRNCLARYCDRGFVFDGKASTVTSCLVSNCFVIASRHEAYYAYRAFYSNFIQCYADYCGYDRYSIINEHNVSPVFTVENCQGLTYNGCGSEQSAKVVALKESNNIVFIGGHFNVVEGTRKNTKISYIDINNCKSVSLIGCHLYDTKNSIARISSIESEDVAMIRCLFRYNGKLANLTRACFLPNSSIVLLYESRDEICNSNTRPVGLTDNEIGFRIFDVDLNKPLWWTKKGWVDANGITIKD